MCGYDYLVSHHLTVGVGEHTHNASTWEVEARGSEAAQGHPQQYTELNTDLPP